MKLQRDAHAIRNIFTAHGTGFVTVGGERYDHPIVVTAEKVYTDWRPQDPDALSEMHFAYFLALQPEVLLLGTGAQQRFLHPGLYRALIAAGIGVEIMSTPAVCRTFNVLIGESRRVVAGVLP